MQKWGSGLIRYIRARIKDMLLVGRKSIDSLSAGRTGGEKRPQVERVRLTGTVANLSILPIEGRARGT